MISKLERESAVLRAIMSAGEPVNSKRICRIIENPWYQDTKSFRASVSSTLGSLRSSGLIACQEIRTVSNKFMNWAKVDRHWFLTPTGFMAINLDTALPAGGFSKGGYVAKKPPRLVGEHNQVGLLPHQQGVMDRIFPVQPRKTSITIKVQIPAWLNGARARTDDMRQMLDDLQVTPPMTLSDYRKRVMRSVAESFGVPREML